MSEFLLAVTALLSGLALRLWARFFRNRQKLLTRPTELADAIPVQEPGLIAMLLPRPLRRIWNGFVLSVCVLIFGIPHLLVIWNFSRDGGHPSQWLYFHYFWTLIYWLALLAAPALVIVRDRQAACNKARNRFMPLRRPRGFGTSGRTD